MGQIVTMKVMYCQTLTRILNTRAKELEWIARDTQYHLLIMKSTQYQIQVNDMMDEIRGVCAACTHSSSSAAENSALAYEKDSKEENNTDDETLEDVIKELENIQTEETRQYKTLNASALPDSGTNKDISLDQFPPDSDEPQVEVSSEELKISPQGCSDDCYSNRTLQNDSGSNDVVLVYVLPNSDQKPEGRQCEAGRAGKIPVENSRLPPSDDALEDGNSAEDVALVYIGPISDEPEPATCSQFKTEEKSSTSTAKRGDQSYIGTADHGSNSNDVTALGISQANGGRQGHDVANTGGNVPGYQPLDQEKREVEEKSRYQKLIKRKV